MSIILKGIDLPTDRKPYGIEVIYRFEGADGLFSEKNYLSPNEAIQIPKDHGRLIDADKFIEDLKYDVEMGRTRYLTDGDEEARKDAECKENCISFIESSATPKILESEEG